MIKFIGAAIWIVAVTVGAVLYSFQSSGGEDAAAAEEPAAMLGGLDYVKTEIVSVPVLRNQEIQGYFLGRFVYTAEAEKLRKLSVPAETLIIDQVYSYLFGNPQVDFTKIETVDMDAFRSGIRDSINARIGEPIIHEVLVEQVDFLTKAEIRDNTLRRRVRGGEAAGAETPAAEGHGAAAAEAAGH